MTDIEALEADAAVLRRKLDDMQRLHANAFSDAYRWALDQGIATTKHELDTLNERIVAASVANW